MSNGIPPIESEDSSDGTDRDRLELEVLALGAKIQRLESKEAGQRYYFRRLAMVTGLTVIGAMFALLGHTLHHLHWWPLVRPDAAVVVAPVVPPVVSVTVITVALFVAAFRRIKDKDTESAANGIAAGLNIFRSS
ncbi:MAG: hypothetical protein LBE86_16115 [Gemmobacter sp.]|jgi:hypothetical protein|nr:hypothetical protein [Gemmobacter sp.]